MSRDFQILGPIEGTVSRFGNGAKVGVPLEWVGRRVRVQLIEAEATKSAGHAGSGGSPPGGA